MGDEKLFPTEELGHGPFGPLLDAFEVMENIPVFKPVPEFSGF
jgi:hypothetical protein